MFTWTTTDLQWLIQRQSPTSYLPSGKSGHYKKKKKDAYSLPCIDRLVDEVIGHNVLSFLEPYSSYNQIPMAEVDKLKISFITNEINQYYEVMPYGLKNVEAIY